MKRYLILILGCICIIALYQNCKKEPLTTLMGTEWLFVHFVDPDDHTQYVYPRGLGDRRLVFESDTTFSFPEGCNYTQGIYGVEHGNMLMVSALGPGTARGCGDFSIWESRIVRVMQQPITYHATIRGLTISNAFGKLHFIRNR